jgi:short-subunit dehydrogenase
MKCAVTGGAGDIGAAILQSFASRGYNPIGIDINAEAVAAISRDLARYADEGSFIVADLATDAGISKVAKALPPELDVFVHAAGINAVGKFENLALERQRAVVNLNLLTPMLLTRALLEHGRLAPHSSLVFVSSLSHFVGYPGASAYAASKDGLAAYARNVSVALADLPVHVTIVYPGPTRTAHAYRYSPDNRHERRRMRPEVLADAIFEGVQTRQHQLIPGFGNRVAAFIGRHSPKLTERVMRKTIFDKLGKRQLY